MKMLALRIWIVLSVSLVVTAAGACSRETSPGTEALLPDSVEAAIHGFTHNVTADGVLRAVVIADSAYQYMGREEWYLFSPQVEFRTSLGAVRSTLTSDRGTYSWRTNNMEARDNVVGLTPDNRRLTTCAIVYTEMSDLIEGPCAFVYDAPNEHLEGDSFEADPDFRNVTATQPRRGTVRDPERGN